MDFREHLKDKFAMKELEGKKMNDYLSSHSLVTLYKLFARPHLDYADTIYEKPKNINICNIEIVQHNAALAITGAFKGSSKEKLYQGIGFEYLSSRKWLRKLPFL